MGDRRIVALFIVVCSLSAGATACYASACDYHVAREGFGTQADVHLLGMTAAEGEEWVTEHLPACVRFDVTASARPVPEARPDGTILDVCQTVDGGQARITVLVADTNAEREHTVPSTMVQYDGSTLTQFDADGARAVPPPCEAEPALIPLEDDR